MEIPDALAALGLNQKQALIYAALLELGPATAYAIARKSGLKRPTVYVILEELRMKEVVLKIPHAKKQIFIAKPPDELVTRAFAGLQEVSQLLPKLRDLMPKDKRPKILYFEGPNEIRQMLWHSPLTGKSKELVGFYAYNAELPKKLLQTIDDYNDHLAKRGVRVRGIVPEHPSLKQYRDSDDEQGRAMHVVPFSQYSSSVSIDIGERFVRLIAYADQQGVIIENTEVANSMRQIFEMVWKKLS